MDKRVGDIPLRVLVIANTSARRAHLVGVTSKALNGSAHVTSDLRISPERFAAAKSDILVASAAAMLDFLRAAPSGTGSVALIDDPEPVWVQSALQQSINAVISSDATSDEIQLALQAAEAGFVLLHPTSVRGLLHAGPLSYTRETDTEELAEDLTARESEVLRLVSLGLGNKEIAVRLAISDHTVKFHISSILSKLQAGSRTEAVSLGIRRGLIPI
jgi:DNA-binding NarL/FixJ family response regulator